MSPFPTVRNTTFPIFPSLLFPKNSKKYGVRGKVEEQKNIEAKISSRKQKIQQLRTYQRGLYEGLIQNQLSKDEYFTFKEKYKAKIKAISEEIE